MPQRWERTGKNRGPDNRMSFNDKAGKPPHWPGLRSQGHEHVGKPHGDACWYPAEGRLPSSLQGVRLLREAAYSSRLFCCECCCWFTKVHLKTDASTWELPRVKTLTWREHDSLILWQAHWMRSLTSEDWVLAPPLNPLTTAVNFSLLNPDFFESVLFSYNMGMIAVALAPSKSCEVWWDNGWNKTPLSKSVQAAITNSIDWLAYKQ